MRSATAAHRGHPTGRARTVITLAVALLGCLAIAAGIALTATHFNGWPGAARDLKGNAVAAEVQLTSAQKKAQNVADTGGRFQVPSVGLDVPLQAMNAVGGAVSPAGFTDAYWIRNVGVAPADASTGTVYVAMHSLRNGGVGPGNYLIDIAKGEAKVADGAEIHVDGVDYTVTGWKAVPKNKLKKDAEVWQAEPGTLVVFTCLQVPSNTASVDNIVITATLAADAS